MRKQSMPSSQELAAHCGRPRLEGGEASDHLMQLEALARTDVLHRTAILSAKSTVF